MLRPSVFNGKAGTQIALNALAQEKSEALREKQENRRVWSEISDVGPVLDDNEDLPYASGSPTADNKAQDKLTTVTAQLKERWGRWQARQAHPEEPSPTRQLSQQQSLRSLSLPPTPQAYRSAGMSPIGMGRGSVPVSPIGMTAPRASSGPLRSPYPVGEAESANRRAALLATYLQPSGLIVPGGNGDGSHGGLDSPSSLPTLHEGGYRASQPYRASHDGGGFPSPPPPRRTAAAAAADSGLIEAAALTGSGGPATRIVFGAASKPAFGAVAKAKTSTMMLPWIVRDEKRNSQTAAVTLPKAGRRIHPDQIEDRDYALQTLAALPHVQLRIPQPTYCGMDLGVSLRFLLQFAESMELTATTRDVVRTFILPQTEATDGRYTDVLPKRDLGRPAYFISHSWNHRFYDLSVAVFRWFRTQAALSVKAPGFIDLDNTFVWLDIFCVNQHQGAQSADDIVNVRDVLHGCDTTLLVLDPQASALNRLWCLYEVWSTVCETRGPENGRVPLLPRRPGPGKLQVLLFNAQWEVVRAHLDRLDVRTALLTEEIERHSFLLAMDIYRPPGCGNQARREGEETAEAVNQALRNALLNSAVAEAAAAPAVSPGLARGGTDERSVDLFCATHTKAAAFELLLGHREAAVSRLPRIVALRLAAAEGSAAASNPAGGDDDDAEYFGDTRDADGWLAIAESSGRTSSMSNASSTSRRRLGGTKSSRSLASDPSVGVLVMDSQLMQVTQMLTLALREAEMYDEVKVVCGAFRVEAVLSGLLASMPPAGMGGGATGGGGPDAAEGMEPICAAYMHLENSLIEAIALGGGWGGARAVGPVAPPTPAPPTPPMTPLGASGAAGAILRRTMTRHTPVVPHPPSAMAVAAGELLKMHARAETLLRCAKRQPAAFRRAIVYGLYNQVILEFAAVLPAILVYRAGQRSWLLEVETLDHTMNTVMLEADAQVRAAAAALAAAAPTPPPTTGGGHSTPRSSVASVVSESPADQAAAYTARQRLDAAAAEAQRRVMQNEMRVLHTRRRDLMLALTFPSVSELRGRLLELGKWVGAARYLDPTSELFLRSLRNTVAVEMLMED